MKKISLLLALLLFNLFFLSSCMSFMGLLFFGNSKGSSSGTDDEKKQAKPVIAVTTFEAKELDDDDVEFLMNMFTVSFVKLGVASVVDRKHFDKIKEEQSFQISDWSDKNKVAELGASLGASYLAVGHLFKREANLFLDVKILDVNTTAIVASYLDKVKNIDDFFEEMLSFCSKLIENTNSGIFPQKKLKTPTSKKSTKVENTSDSSHDNLLSHENVAEKEYRIGDVGPGGGIVFYVNPQGFVVYDGIGGVKMCHYLEMSVNTLGESTWFPSLVEILTQTGLGYGKSNTYKIINKYSVEEKNEENCAAYRCFRYHTENTKAGEWWLPSKDELDLIYRNVKEQVFASSFNNIHCSSSEYNLYYVWNQDFDYEHSYSGLSGYSSKAIKNSVRAVRAF